MKPLDNRVLVLIPDEPKVKMAGSIILPDSMEKEQFPEAKVIAVGHKCEEVKAGDTILIDRYALASRRIRFQDKEHFLIAEPDIIGIITK